MIYWFGGVYELLRVYKSINLEKQSPLKVFEYTIEGSVDSMLVEEVEAQEEMHESGSRVFYNEFNIRVCGSREDYEELL